MSLVNSIDEARAFSDRPRDMGLLLAFIFLLNRLGALVWVPALARFLLPGTREGVIAEPACSPQPSTPSG